MSDEYSDLIRVVELLTTTLEKHGIGHESMRVIFNVTDRREAARLDAFIRRALNNTALMHTGSHEVDTRKFKIHGLEVRLEIPFHDPSK